jgi:hypothetical protein
MPATAQVIEELLVVKVMHKPRSAKRQVPLKAALRYRAPWIGKTLVFSARRRSQQKRLNIPERTEIDRIKAGGCNSGETRVALRW